MNDAAEDLLGLARVGCVACHMPPREVGRGLKFTDHWIRASAGKVP